MDEQKLQALLKDMTLQEQIEQLVQLDSSVFDNDGAYRRIRACRSQPFVSQLQCACHPETVLIHSVRFHASIL